MHSGIQLCRSSERSVDSHPAAAALATLQESKSNPRVGPSLLRQECDVLVERVKQRLGDDVLCMAACRTGELKLEDTRKGKGKRRSWTVVVVCSDPEEATDHRELDKKGGPFDASGPSSCLPRDFELHRMWLKARGTSVEQAGVDMQGRLSIALDRADLEPATRETLRRVHEALKAGDFSVLVPGSKGDQTPPASRDREHWSRQVCLRLADRTLQHRRAALDAIADEVNTELNRRSGGAIQVDIVHADLETIRSWSRTDPKGNRMRALVRGSVYDRRGLLWLLAAANRHAALVRKKFGRYYVGYALTGSRVTRPHEATPRSDIDVLVLMDDTDVVRMTLDDLRTRLQSGLDSMAAEASQEFGCSPDALHVTLQTLTEALHSNRQGDVVLWAMLKGALIVHDPKRYLHGWQKLLDDGRFGVSPVYVDRLRASSRAYFRRAEDRFLQIVLEDLFPSVVTLSQSLLLMAGQTVLPPAVIPSRLRAMASEPAQRRNRGGLEKCAATLAELYRLHRARKQEVWTRPGPLEVAELTERTRACLEILERLCDSQVRRGPRAPRLVRPA